MKFREKQDASRVIPESIWLKFCQSCGVAHHTLSPCHICNYAGALDFHAEARGLL